MKVTYLGHSGFYLETERADLMFDYYRGTLPVPKADRPLYVFVSHAHEDHFSYRIFSLPGENVYFVLSGDISANEVPVPLLMSGRVVYIGPDQEASLPGGGGLRVRTFRSTDEGVAFLLDIPEGPAEDSAANADGSGGSFLRIYHAGDLNDWHWDDEDQAWNEEQYRGYQDALKKIALCVKADGHLPDAAFVPVDTRLGEGSFFWMGPDEYMKAVGAKHLFGMHFYGDPKVLDRLRALPCAAEYADRIMGSGTPGETFLL